MADQVGEAWETRSRSQTMKAIIRRAPYWRVDPAIVLSYQIRLPAPQAGRGELKAVGIPNDPDTLDAFERTHRINRHKYKRHTLESLIVAAWIETFGQRPLPPAFDTDPDA